MSDAGKVDGGAGAAGAASGAASAGNAGAAASAEGAATGGAGGTIAGSDGAGAAGAAAAGAADAGKGAAAEAGKGQTFPDAWREELSGGDEKFMAVLKRYASPKTFAEGFWNLRRRHDAGEFKRPLGENPTPDEIKQYREENGVPADAAGYALPDGLKISDSDKPIIDGFRQLAHNDLNLPAPQFAKVVDWYFRAQAQANEQQIAADAEHKAATEDAIRAEWGRDFRANVQAINNWLDGSAPKGLKDRLLSGRMADGRLIGDDPEALRWLAQTARSSNPLSAVVGSGGGGSTASAEARLAEISALMGDRASKYWKGPEADGLQKEWRDLKTALDAAKPKAA